MRIAGFFAGVLCALTISTAVTAEPLECGQRPSKDRVGAAKSIVLNQWLPARGKVNVLVVFARFADDPHSPVPTYGGDLFDVKLPGSFSHFYHTMSFGQLQVTGTVLPKRYVSERPHSAYVAERADEIGHYGQFVGEILRQVDADIDLGQFDNDGADGVANSGDDDGLVDYLFVNFLSAPSGFIIGRASGIAGLGLKTDYSTADVGIDGAPISVRGTFPQGAVVQEGTFAQTVGSMAHEFGHSLGLPDLYDLDYNEPAADSAGIGKWGLMGWGAHGWNGADGPNPMCAWSREQLGWIGRDNERLVEVRNDTAQLEIADLQRGGFVYKIMLPAESLDDLRAGQTYLLLEHRLRTAHYYNRHMPAEGLLVWQIDPGASHSNNGEMGKLVDLVCADGLYGDAGYPAGQVAAPRRGRDNLDFWAHDPDYAAAHQGNRGDATDVFDGVVFTALDLASNPSTYMGAIPSAANSGLALRRLQRRGEHMVVDISLPHWAGTISEKVHWMGEVIVDGDLTIAPEGALIIHKRARVRFTAADRLQAGADPMLCELRVQGKLKIETDLGQALLTEEGVVTIPPQPVIFEALFAGASWAGIFSLNAADLQVKEKDYVLRDAVCGTLASDTCLSTEPVNYPTAVEAREVLPVAFGLLPNYPNPFNPQTTIRYVLPQGAALRLVVYNALGQVVRTLVEGFRAAGKQAVTWDGRDQGGRQVAGGVYLYSLEVEGQPRWVRQMVLVR